MNIIKKIIYSCKKIYKKKKNVILINLFLFFNQVNYGKRPSFKNV